MSQAKVERYKKEKANRQKLMKRAKVKAVCLKIGGAVVGLALVIFVAGSAYVKYDENKTRPSVEVDYGAVGDYVEQLSADAEE